nr:unnamed protein product [Callosobruchus chinensis]
MLIGLCLLPGEVECRKLVLSGPFGQSLRQLPDQSLVELLWVIGKSACRCSRCGRRCHELGTTASTSTCPASVGSAPWGHHVCPAHKLSTVTARHATWSASWAIRAVGPEVAAHAAHLSTRMVHRST